MVTIVGPLPRRLERLRLVGVEPLDPRPSRAPASTSGCSSPGCPRPWPRAGPSNASRTSRPSSRASSSRALHGSIMRSVATPCDSSADGALPRISTSTARCSGVERSLVHDGEGDVSFEAVRALQACLRADVEIVLMSGRRRIQVAEDARLFGQSAYIFEAGACVVLGAGLLGPASAASAQGRPAPRASCSSAGSPGSASVAPGAGSGVRVGLPPMARSTGSPADASRRAHDRPADRAQSARPRCCSSATRAARVPRALAHRARGLAPVPRPGRRRRGRRAARRARPRATCAWSTTASSTAAPRRLRICRRCAAITWSRAASKATAVAFHRRVRGYAREETFAVGDSREDLACAEHVGAFWLVANALERDPSMREAIAGHDNVRVAEARPRRGRLRGGREHARHSMSPSRFSSS